jgi:acyl-CoA thioesterase I
MRLSRSLRIAAVAFAAATFSPLMPAEAQERACNDTAKLARLRAPLVHMARRVAAGGPLTILALGSSSTAGAGASGPAASYPSRLAVELKTLFPDLAVTVLNRGVNGEEAAEMLARFEQSGATDKPDVVLWQIGTNSVLRDRSLDHYEEVIQHGLARMKAVGADVVLIDPQFAPKVIAMPEAAEMVSLIAAAATKRGVDLFPRFAIMRAWHEDEAIPFEGFLAPDQLHMNDWGYACLAKLVGTALAEAATRPIAAARAITR